MKQKDVFLESEGDAWYNRNARALQAQELPGSDPLLTHIVDLTPIPAPGTRILEIGCGDGTRLAWLREKLGFVCKGIDPSATAVGVARGRGIDARVATADALPFAEQMFDIIVFGFCLYLCDREDLFRIAAEADRVLMDPGWLLIHDFYSPSPTTREYHHRSGLVSYKMDYGELFNWHPGYTRMSHTVRHHGGNQYTDDRAEWVATSVIRKNLSGGR